MHQRSAASARCESMAVKWRVTMKEKVGPRRGLPRSTEFQAEKIRLVVTKNIGYSPDAWIAFCGTFIHGHVLKGGKLEEAQAEAVQLLRNELHRSLKSL